MNDYIKKRIAELADEKYRDFSSALIPGVHIRAFHGVRIPMLRALAKEVSKTDIKKYLENASNDSYEEITLQGMVISSIKGDFHTIKPYVATFIPKIDNWGVCDIFCCGLKNMGKHKNETWEFIKPYFSSDKEFYVRFATVMTLAHLVEENSLKNIFAELNKITQDGYYVKMGVAWLISVCFIKFPDATMEYLKNNKLDNFTYNKSLQKIIESYRVDADTKNILRSMKRKNK